MFQYTVIKLHLSDTGVFDYSHFASDGSYFKLEGLHNKYSIIILKDSFPTVEKAHCVAITKIIQIILSRNINGVGYETHRCV